MTPLVTAGWLASRIGDPSVAILDSTLPPVGVTPVLDTYARFLEQHIPGAHFFDIEELSDHATSLPHMLPSAERFARDMSALGVSDEQTIVVYEQSGVFSAPRAWWALRAFGAREVYVLDGDLHAWLAAGLPTEAGEPQNRPATFHAKLSAHAVRSFAQVQAALASGEQVLDARSAGRFSGQVPEPRPGLRAGHMPGALSLPFTSLVEQGRLKNAEQLRVAFADAGVDLAAPVTTTCGSGVTAAVLALGLAIAGAQQVSLYDGSWAEYAQHPDAVIETGPPGAAE